MNSTNPVESELPTGPSVPFPFDVSFVDSETSPAVRYQIEEHLERLSHFYDRITYAHVYVRIPHKHGRRSFHVHVQLDVPGRRIAVSRDCEDSDKLMDVHIAVRDAFNKVTRQLEDFAKVRRGHKGLGLVNV
jgi:ribosomal subunit interface protein